MLPILFPPHTPKHFSKLHTHLVGSAHVPSGRLKASTSNISAHQLINTTDTNLSITVHLLSIALTERRAERQFRRPTYVQIRPELLPEYVLQMHEVRTAQILMHPAWSKQSEREVVLANKFDSLQHHHILCFITHGTQRTLHCPRHADKCESLDVNTLIMGQLSRFRNFYQICHSIS